MDCFFLLPHQLGQSLYEEDLPDPVWFDPGSRSEGRQDHFSLFQQCNETERNQLAVKISFDEGLTCELTIPMDNTGDTAKLPWAAYSDLVKLEENTLGLLYEWNNYQEIFKHVKWSD